MTPFTYARAADAAEAIRLGAQPQAKYLGGGTNLVDLLRETLERRPRWSTSLASQARSRSGRTAAC
jgi:CO/xanthine dehydrogenase FAD-binding subunit